MICDEQMSEIRIIIASDRDIVVARQAGRSLAEEMGFSRTNQALIATAISEIARNIVRYANTGEMLISRTKGTNRNRSGLRMFACDEGPGIANLSDAMLDGFSTGQSLGLGLPGTRRIMDDFEIESEIGKGVKVTATKWLDS